MNVDHVPEPILFNLWKHHAGAIRNRIHSTADAGPDAVAKLPTELVVIGADLMDLYLGELSPLILAERVLGFLDENGAARSEDYQKWIHDNGGYRVLELPEDGSFWTLRWGIGADRFVHLHPGRWSPATMRVRANVLKTAIMVHAHVLLHGGDPYETELVNRVRVAHLGFAPVRQVVRDEGLGLAIRALA